MTLQAKQLFAEFDLPVYAEGFACDATAEAVKLQAVSNTAKRKSLEIVKFRWWSR